MRLPAAAGGARKTARKPLTAAKTVAAGDQLTWAAGACAVTLA